MLRWCLSCSPKNNRRTLSFIYPIRTSPYTTANASQPKSLPIHRVGVAKPPATLAGRSPHGKSSRTESTVDIDHTAASSWTDASEALVALRNCISPKALPNLSKEHTPERLESLYVLVRRHPQVLRRLAPQELSTLISLFGTASSSPFMPLSSFNHRYAWTPDDTASARTYWSLVRSIGADKAQLCRHLLASDHYWLMRAEIVNVDVYSTEEGDQLQRSEVMARVTSHYTCASKETLRPEAHVAYLNALRSMHTARHYEDMISTLSDVLRIYDVIHPSLLSFLWSCSLDPEFDISSTLQEKLVNALMSRVMATDTQQSSRNSTSGQDAAARVVLVDLGKALFASIFPQPHVSGHSEVLQWANLQSRNALAPEMTIQERWLNLQLLAVFKAPVELTSKRSDIDHSYHVQNPNPVTVEWSTVYVLLSLTQIIKPLGSALITSNLAKGFRQLIRSLWQSWSKAEYAHLRPRVVDRPIVSGFLRLATSTRDASLAHACRRYSLKHCLWEHDQKSVSDVRALLTDYVIAAVSSEDTAWQDVFIDKNICHESLHSFVANTAMKQTIIERDVITAYRMYNFFQRNPPNVRMSGRSLRHLCLGLIDHDRLELAIPFLQNPRVSPDDLELIFGTILLPLARRRTQRIDSVMQAPLAQAMLKTYASKKPTTFIRHRLQYVLPVLASTGQAANVIQIVRRIIKNAPGFFQYRFFVRLIHTMTRIRQFRFVIKLLRSVHRFHPSPDLAAKLRQSVVVLFVKKGARALAKQVARRGQRRTSLERLTVAASYRYWNPRSPRALSILSIIRPSSTPSELQYALTLLANGRYLSAARKLFARMHTDLDEATKTSCCNTILHGMVSMHVSPYAKKHPSKNARLVRHAHNMLNFLIKEYNFKQDRVTTNILIKAIVRWGNRMDSGRLQALFDVIVVRGGYPGGPRSPPFGTNGAQLDIQFPEFEEFVSFERHVRPMYKMFITAFHARRDDAAAAVVKSVLNFEHGRRQIARETWNEAQSWRKMQKRRGLTGRKAGEHGR